MGLLEFIAAGASGLVLQGLGFFFYVKFELRQIRKDMELSDLTIEEKRAANVEKLREIYDQKIEQSRLYAKGLFDSHNSEFRAINEKMERVENTLTKILDLLLKK